MRRQTMSETLNLLKTKLDNFEVDVLGRVSVYDVGNNTKRRLGAVESSQVEACIRGLNGLKRNNIVSIYFYTPNNLAMTLKKSPK